jgi:hypothetical protein
MIILPLHLVLWHVKNRLRLRAVSVCGRPIGRAGSRTDLAPGTYFPGRRPINEPPRFPLVRAVLVDLSGPGFVAPMKLGPKFLGSGWKQERFNVSSRRHNYIA